MKIPSVRMESSTAKTKRMNITEKESVSLRKKSFGDKISRFKMKIEDRIRETKLDEVKQELTMSFLSLDLGRNLMKAMLNPRVDRFARRRAAEISVEASPTLMGE